MKERRKSGWVKAAVAVFSALIFVVGLAGAPADLQTWYGWLQRGVPWWAFIAASVILPSLVWFPEIRSLVDRKRTRPRKPQPRLGKSPIAKPQPAAASSTATSPPMSSEERESIHRMRILWDPQLGGGSEATSKMSYLSVNILEDIAVATVYWLRDVLEPRIQNLDVCKKRMDEIIGAADDASLDEIIEGFNSVWMAYIELAGWLHTVEYHESLDLLKEPHAERYHRWEAVNKPFYSQLQVLSKWPEYQGRLSHRAGDNAAAHQFLQRNHFPDDPQPLANYIQPPGDATPSTVDALVERYEYGVHNILNGYTSLSDKYQILGMINEDDEWIASTIDRMKERGCTKAEISHFSTIGTYKPVGGLHTDPQTNKKAQECSIRLDRLKEIITKYDSATPLARPAKKQNRLRSSGFKHLTEDFKAGAELRDKCKDRSQPAPSDTEIKKWIETTERHVREYLGDYHVAQFGDFSGYILVTGREHPCYRTVEERLRRLKEFLDQLSS